MDSDGKEDVDIVGESVIKLSELQPGTSAKNLSLMHEGKPAGTITANMLVEVNKNYEKQAGFIGKLIISGLKANIASASSSGDPMCIFEIDEEKRQTTSAINCDDEPKWKD